MSADFIKELQWRGMIHDIMPGTEERLGRGMCCGYVGFDPTAQSLQIGNLVAIMLLVHLQRAGHKPIALVGGATGMIGDPSGKSEERNLLSIDELRHNQDCFKKQLGKFLDFGSASNGAEIVNNFDWFKNIGFLDFLRDAGKHLTIGYMMAKDSVQNRLEAGISYTEFSYQLLQAYDFFWLYKNKNCELQMGGSDQWGNITAGCELVRRKAQGDVYAIVAPLLTKSDGTKFGKSAAGERIWLDPNMTSPYKFYQFWLNATDGDAPKFLRTFSTLEKEEVEALEQEHAKAPHQRILQKALAREVTIRVHSEQDYNGAVEASEILFGGGTSDTLKRLSEKEFLNVFEGVPQDKISKSDLASGINIVEFLAAKTTILSSKGEARRLIQNNGISLNKERIPDANFFVTSSMLLNGRYLLVQIGKKNYHLVIAG